MKYVDENAVSVLTFNRFLPDKLDGYDNTELLDTKNISN
jgi:hypothetical protein